MTSRSRWLGIIALILIPASASPLGLGEITLNSYLNERLDAEISVSVSGPDELRSINVAVASRDVFERFGIDRADMLDDLRFKVESGPGGQAVIHITSTEPVVEPFLTFLIEARSSGGRLLREYTVLLDPPLFVPQPETAEPAPAAPIQPAPSQGAISRPRAEPAQTQPRPAPVASATTYGPVRRNETLWGIAEQVRPDSDLSMNQVMISLFEANPDAFNGNINRLRAGAILRVPDFSSMSRLSRAEAAAEVRRQNTDWRQAAKTSIAAAPAQPAPVRPTEEPEQRLKLVPPEPEKAAGAGAGPAGAADKFQTEQEALNDELLAAMNAMRDELRDTQEQIAVRDAEIAELQQQLAKLQQQPAEVAPGGAGAEPAAEPVAGQASQPATTPAPPPQKAEPAPTPPPAQLTKPEEEGGVFSSIWTWLLIVVVILAGGAVAWRRRQESEPDEGYESWASTTRSGAAPAASAAGAGAATATAASKPEFDAGDFEQFEEDMAAPEPAPPPKPAPQPSPEPAARPEPKAAPADDRPDTTGEYAYPFEDTIAGATGINLEQSDPLAEADFHMAYGLYDQAADLIRKAVDREPDRTDLRMKLLDILFVWGKEDKFLEEATALNERIGDTSSSDWERVAIMGRQICPDAELFEAGLSVAGADRPASTDGEGLDFDLGSESTRNGESDSIDFDIGTTGERPALRTRDETPAVDATAELEIEDLGLDVDLPIGEEDQTVQESGASEAEAGATELTEVLEPTAEIPEDETGLTEVMDTGGGEKPEETGLTEVLERVDRAADDQTAVVRAEDLDIADMDTEGETKELPALKAASPDEDTAEVEAMSEDDLDLEDLTAELDDDLDKTAEIPIAGFGPDGETLIEEIFGDDEATKIAPMPGVRGGPEDVEPTREMPEVRPSDVTLSEVGTKLDLARAYMDMGDPDGARSILEEVLDEGDDAQKDEARQLMDGLN